MWTALFPANLLRTVINYYLCSAPALLIKANTETIILGTVEKEHVSRHVDGIYVPNDGEIMCEHSGILLSLWMSCKINENIPRSNSQDIAEWLIMYTIWGKNEVISSGFRVYHWGCYSSMIEPWASRIVDIIYGSNEFLISHRDGAIRGCIWVFPVIPSIFHEKINYTLS